MNRMNIRLNVGKQTCRRRKQKSVQYETESAMQLVKEHMTEKV